MMDPWEIRPDDTRIPNSLPTFIIFCEDEVSERIYFKYLETPKIKVNPIGGQHSKIENVLKAICYCKEEGLMENNHEGLPVLQVDDTFVWCVFDRDTEDTHKKIVLGNASFDESIRMAEEKGFNVAWSNDAFELWVLLHFEHVDETNPENQHRNAYYRRLTEIFRTHPNPNDDLIRALRYPGFSYKDSLKHENNFRYIVRSEIIGRTREAIARADRLEQHFNKIASFPNHQKAPCTLIHHLVQELLRLGGKVL